MLLDLGDTSSAAGEMTANVIASAGQYERRLIEQRSREGLAARRAAGVRLGRPSVLPEDVVRRIVGARADGAKLREIAEALTADWSADGARWGRLVDVKRAVGARWAGRCPPCSESQRMKSGVASQRPTSLVRLVRWIPQRRANGRPSLIAAR